MKPDAFVHLHFHTEYSLLDGACKVKQTMARARELGMTQLAMTDHGVLFGAIEFYNTAIRNGIKPILGCEVYIAHGRMQERKLAEGKGQAHHLVLLSETKEGFYNLMRLVSMAHLEGMYYKPRIDKELLAQHARGLIALSACVKGEVAEAAARDDMESAARLADEYRQIMGPDSFYLEVQDHGLPAQKIANKNLIQLSKRMGLPLVATNDVHYLHAGDAEAHEMLLCLQTAAKWSDPSRMKYGSDQFYMKSGAEMARLFGEIPEAIRNTTSIADRCGVELELGSDNPDKLHFPTYQIPGEFGNQREYLIHIARQGARKRYGVENLEQPDSERGKAVRERFYHELAIIEKTKFINYFLVVWDFIHWAKSQRIPVGPGRGSGAGSIVAYLMGITDIDPLRYGLIFERFLNPDRVSPPDFDVDFCQERRGEVIEYVREKYGREAVAQIITFGTLGAKTVIRDIGRALEIPLSECDVLAKMVPDGPDITLAKAQEQNPELRAKIKADSTAQRIYNYAKVLEGLPRNPGKHAAGVVIGEKPLIDIVPLTRDKDKEVLVQWEMSSIEQAGMLKMDFLGLKTLTVIQEAVDWIKQTRGIALDMLTVPLDDPKTFELLARGDSAGVFQVESAGMRDLLRQLQMNRFEELSDMIALYRPGPMDMIPKFINRKHGRENIEYDHPLLEPILRDTYGILLYQEQVQMAARTLAGFSLGEGDILRRAMGKKDLAKMAQQRDKFIEGCKKTHNIPASRAGDIFDKIAKFAGYGFNKSHSTGYAMVAYQTAYLKANYPVEFMAALLSSEMDNTDKLPILVREVQEMGIPVLPPNVNDSGMRFTPCGDSIRYGLAGIKNVGRGAAEALIAERATRPYKGLLEFCARLDSQTFNRKTLESLIKCGAFDFTGLSRARLFEGIELAQRRAVQTQADRAAGQGSFFDLLGGGVPGASSQELDDAAVLPDAAPWPESKQLAAEKELIGFYISGHPLSIHEWTLKTFNQLSFEKLNETPSGTLSRIGGMVTQVRRTFTKNKENPRPMCFFTLESFEGSLDVVVFPDAFQQFQNLLKDEQPVMVCGQLDKMETRVTLKAREIYALEEVPVRFTRQITVHIPFDLPLDKKRAMQAVVNRHQGNTRLHLCIQMPMGEKVFVETGSTSSVRPSNRLVQELERIIGEECVYVEPVAAACLIAPPERRWGGKDRG